MSSIPATLNALMLTPVDPAETGSALDEADFSEVRANISGLPQIGWPAVKSAVIDAMAAMLDVKIVDILSNAWSTLRDLQEYLDKERHPPEELAVVPLLKHTVRSSHAPTIELLAGEQVIAKLVFDVQLVLSLEGVALKIRDGRIIEVVSGTLQGKGTLKFAGKTLLEKPTPVYVIPGEISFGEGIAIPKMPGAT